MKNNPPTIRSRWDLAGTISAESDPAYITTSTLTSQVAEIDAAIAAVVAANNALMPELKELTAREEAAHKASPDWLWEAMKPSPALRELEAGHASLCDEADRLVALRAAALSREMFA